MIRDDDTRVVRLYGTALGADGAADGGEEQPRRAPGEPSAPVYARQHGDHEHQRNDDAEQGQPGIAAVGEMEDASHGRSDVLRLWAVRPAFMSSLPSPQCDIRNGLADVFCDT